MLVPFGRYPIVPPIIAADYSSLSRRRTPLTDARAKAIVPPKLKIAVTAVLKSIAAVTAEKSVPVAIETPANMDKNSAEIAT